MGAAGIMFGFSDSPFGVCLCSRGVLFGILPCWFFGFDVLWCSLAMGKVFFLW